MSPNWENYSIEYTKTREISPIKKYMPSKTQDHWKMQHEYGKIHMVYY